MNPNITKDGVEVRAGQIWRDLDKRESGRTIKVVSVAEGKALSRDHVKLTGFTCRMNRPISVRRMHKGGTGWELVSQPEDEK
jgi:hypothetical protein